MFYCQGIKIDEESISRLLHNYDNGWIDDSLINAYMKLLVSINSSFDALDTSSFILMKQSEWKDVLSCNFNRKVSKILIPICFNHHWSLAIIDLVNRVIEFYDSAYTYHNTIIELITQYANLKFKTPFMIYTCDKMPGQQNGSDCGLFLCAYAKQAVLGLDISDTPPIDRRRFAYELFESVVV